MSVCHAEKVVTDPVWAQRWPALFFHFLRFLSSRVQSEGFYLALCNCCQLLLSRSCSQIAVSWQPPSVFPTRSSLPAARMHVQPWFSLHHLESSEDALGGGDRGGPSGAATCCLPALSLPSTCGSTSALPCCLCKCRTRRQTHTNLQLSQSWRVDFWNFPPENLHFWGFSSVSCLPVRHPDCFFYCFSVPFPLVFYFLWV